ncbi:MAG TPA: ATP synthase F1 subunit delta [Lacipirellulaceae bacterium]|jgi:F-type H+-transporting ATPase subunit delta|nr:ATP synthase F1 subunit delta [Lacipirellulaceae bacterium]
MASMEESQKPKHDTVMDVAEEQIARVYAKAFLGATEKSADADGLVEELTSFSDDVLNRFPKLEQALNSSLVSEEQKEQMLGRIFSGKASQEVLNFLKVLSRHGRLNLVRQAARLVKSMHAKRRGMTDVEVRVAAPLDDATYAEILTQLRKSLGTEPVLTVKVNPALLGGIVIRVGDRVYDGSVQSQLERMRATMISKATQQIESRRDAFMTV